MGEGKGKGKGAGKGERRKGMARGTGSVRVVEGTVARVGEAASTKMRRGEDRGGVQEETQTLKAEELEWAGAGRNVG